MIGPVYLFRAGCFALSGLGCGLAASLLKGRTIANWTWMASTMTFQQGAMIGSGLAVANLCAALFLKKIDEIAWLTQPQKSLAKACISWSPFLLSPIIYMFWQFPILSSLTFQIISNLSIQTISKLYVRACQLMPPFYRPPGWNWVDISQQVDGLRCERSENGSVVQWIMFTKENYSKSLEVYKNLLLIGHENNGRTARVLGRCGVLKDPNVLLSVTEPSQRGNFLFHQLVIVKNGVAYTLIVGASEAEFGKYTELFNQVLSSLKV